ncbi:unnamed protein product [Vicia faba]|uniref:Complex 1 LYR protein domain-containing protein n=1 Tax=Vicia faba TaxID=3906 RepID=A0AAV1A8X2_VICFA|nr:unnamed protein product [Vicia faba]
MRGKWRSVWNWNRNLVNVKLKRENGCRWRLLHEGPDSVEELLDRHLVKKANNNNTDDDEDELQNRRRLTTTRREALSLYRDILRASRYFAWSDSKGVLWRDLIRDSARKEFELARFETDPEVVTRLLIGGHEAVNNAIEKLAEKQRQQIQKDRGGGSGDPDQT